jgi:hypothetical protein
LDRLLFKELHFCENLNDSDKTRNELDLSVVKLDQMIEIKTFGDYEKFTQRLCNITRDPTIREYDIKEAFACLKMHHVFGNDVFLKDFCLLPNKILTFRSINVEDKSVDMVKIEEKDQTPNLPLKKIDSFWIYGKKANYGMQDFNAICDVNEIFPYHLMKSDNEKDLFYFSKERNDELLNNENVVKNFIIHATVWEILN